MKHPLNPRFCREAFPALERKLDGVPVVYLDGPAGSQVPQTVADAVGGYLVGSNANCGGRFMTSRETDDLLGEARRAVADFLGTKDPELVSFGPNMTTLTFALSRALARTWRAGDEVVVTRLDHDANFTPWILAARETGATVRCVDIRKEDCSLDMDDLRRKINEHTRLLAVTCASNAVGTVTPVREMAAMVHQAGGQIFLDAVHIAPHRAIDIEAWDCDYLVCSAYKFFGPHVGIQWGRRELLEALPAYKVRPAPDRLPARWMNGTQSHEGIAGTRAAIEYLADLGRVASPEVTGRRNALLAAFDAIGDHEKALGAHLLRGLAGLRDVQVHGITDPERLDERVPTVSFTHARRSPGATAEYLAELGIFVWSGNFYALPLTEALGLEPAGMVRLGLLHYNTMEEVDRLIAALAELESSDP